MMVYKDLDYKIPGPTRYRSNGTVPVVDFTTPDASSSTPSQHRLQRPHPNKTDGKANRTQSLDYTYDFSKLSGAKSATEEGAVKNSRAGPT